MCPFLPPKGGFINTSPRHSRVKPLSFLVKTFFAGTQCDLPGEQGSRSNCRRRASNISGGVYHSSLSPMHLSCSAIAPPLSPTGIIAERSAGEEAGNKTDHPRQPNQPENEPGRHHELPREIVPRAASQVSQAQGCVCWASMPRACWMVRGAARVIDAMPPRPGA